MKRLELAAAVLGILCPVVSADPIEDVEQAFTYSAQGQWEKAADSYAEVLAANPYHGIVWQRYGYALHQLGRYDEAISAFTESMELGFRPVISMYNIACGHALLGHRDDALDWLELAMDSGFEEQELLETDSDLDSLRDKARFKVIAGVFPPPDLSRNEEWRYDLDFLARRMEQVHYDLYGVVSREDFAAALADLKARVPELADHEIAVGIQRILAMVGDGHTHLLPPMEGRLEIHQYPIELYFFSDGLYVLAADPAYAAAVGGRVVRLGALPAEEAFQRVAGICSVDNAMGYRSRAPQYMVVPEVLHALGVIDEPDAALPLTVETRDGEPTTVYVEPGPFGGLGTGSIVHARDDTGAPVPLWLKDKENNFWFEHLEKDRLVYVQFNTVRDKADESIAEFSNRLFSFIEEHPVEYLVIDMRRNHGGNNFLNQPLVHGLIKCDAVNRRGHLFVIAGRATFSAAMNGAADIETHTNALFVGEPTGSRPNFVGETTIIALPCTGLRLSCSSLYWQRSHASDHRTWIAPDIVAEMSSEDYRTNRDPAMEAILDYILGES